MSCLTILFQSADRVKIWIQAAEAACYCHAVGADHHPGAWSWRHRSAQSRTGRRHLEPNPKHHNTGNRWEQMGTDGNRWEQVEGDWNSRSWDASTFKLWHPKQIQKFHVQQAAKWLQHSAHRSHRSEITTQLFWPPHIAESWESTQGKQSDVKWWSDVTRIYIEIYVYIIYIYHYISIQEWIWCESVRSFSGASVELQWSFSGASVEQWSPWCYEAEGEHTEHTQARQRARPT